jgi:hypothetical protein
MRILFISFCLCFFGHDLMGQGNVPNDFIVKHISDTIYGRIQMDMRDTNGVDHQIIPANVRTFTIYTSVTGFSSKPKYFASTWVNINGKFYEILYKDDLGISLYRMQPGLYGNGNSSNVVYMPVNQNIASGFDPSIQGPDIYYFGKKNVLTGFKKKEFYDAAKDYFSDCKEVLQLVDSVPNSKNPTKTHKAKIDDAVFLLEKYNSCTKLK